MKKKDIKLRLEETLQFVENELPITKDEQAYYYLLGVKQTLNDALELLSR